MGRSLYQFSRANIFLLILASQLRSRFKGKPLSAFFMFLFSIGSAYFLQIHSVFLLPCQGLGLGSPVWRQPLSWLKILPGLSSPCKHQGGVDLDLADPQRGAGCGGFRARVAGSFAPHDPWLDFGVTKSPQRDPVGQNWVCFEIGEPTELCSFGLKAFHFLKSNLPKV